MYWQKLWGHQRAFHIEKGLGKRNYCTDLLRTYIIKNYHWRNKTISAVAMASSVKRNQSKPRFDGSRDAYDRIPLTWNPGGYVSEWRERVISQWVRERVISQWVRERVTNRDAFASQKKSRHWGCEGGCERHREDIEKLPHLKLIYVNSACMSRPYS